MISLAVYWDKLSAMPLFEGMGREELLFMIDCLDPKAVTLEKGELLYSACHTLESFAAITEGGFELMRKGPGESKLPVFHRAVGEFIALSRIINPKWSPSADVIAQDDSEVVLFNALGLPEYERRCPRGYSRLAVNAARLMGDYKKELFDRLSLLSCRSTRDKVIMLLQMQCAKDGSQYFDLDMSRQEMADFLAVDRSALSRELSKLRDEGLIDFQRNHFRLCQELLPPKGEN